MAKIRKQVLGIISGAVGDVLFRVKSGVAYVGTKPISFIPGTDSASVLRRSRFTMATKFSRAINSVPELKSIWKEVTPSRLTQYNMIVKFNYHNVQPDAVSNLVKLVPDIGFSVNISDVSISASELGVQIASVSANAGIDPATELYFKLVGVLHLSNPIDESTYPHAFMRVVSEESPLDLENPLIYNISFMDQVNQLIEQYQVHKVFLTLLTLDINKNPVHYSNTFFNT